MIQLNLLPPERKRYLSGRRRNRQITFFGSVVVVLLILAAFTAFGASLYVGAVVAAQKRRIEQTKDDLKRFAEIEKLTLATRDRVSSLAALEKSRILWSKVLEDLAAATPEGARLTQVSFSILTPPHLQVSGEADSKEKVAALRERLEADERFENVGISQIGQTQSATGKPVTTFSLKANIPGIAVPEAPQQPKAQQ